MGKNKKMAGAIVVVFSQRIDWNTILKIQKKNNLCETLAVCGMSDIGTILLGITSVSRERVLCTIHNNRTSCKGSTFILWDTSFILDTMLCIGQ